LKNSGLFEKNKGANSQKRMENNKIVQVSKIKKNTYSTENQSKYYMDDYF